MKLNSRYQIIEGPLKGIKGIAVEYDKETGLVELKLGSETTTTIHYRFLRAVLK